MGKRERRAAKAALAEKKWFAKKPSEENKKSSKNQIHQNKIDGDVS